MAMATTADAIRGSSRARRPLSHRFEDPGLDSRIQAGPRPGHRCNRLPWHGYAGDSTFSRPLTKSASPSLQAREGTRWGVNGDSDASGSARQQQTSRRSTGREQAPKARAVSPPGSRLGLTSGDPRQQRNRPTREPDGRTDGPEPGHLMLRSARRRPEAGRALGRRAIGTGAPGECRG